MHNVRKCLGCNRLVGFQVSPYLKGPSEGRTMAEDGNVIIPVSLGSGLLLIGGQITGFTNPEIQKIISDNCGLNIKELFGSGFCPVCFPSPENDDSQDEDEASDESDDEDWYDEDDEDEKPVKVLRVPSSGSVQSLVVRGLMDMKKRSEINGDFDSWYLRDLGVYFWYDAHAAQKDLPINAFCSVLAGSCVQGTMMVIGDLKKDLTRSNDWRDLPEGWLSPQLAQVISIVNSDQRVLALLKKTFNK